MSTDFLHSVTSEEEAGPHLIMLNLLFKQKNNFINCLCPLHVIVELNFDIERSLLRTTGTQCKKITM